MRPFESKESRDAYVKEVQDVYIDQIERYCDNCEDPATDEQELVSSKEASQEAMASYKHAISQPFDY